MQLHTSVHETDVGMIQEQKMDAAGKEDVLLSIIYCPAVDI